MHTRTYISYRYRRRFFHTRDRRSRRLVSRAFDINVLRRRLTGGTVGGGARQGTRTTPGIYNLTYSRDVDGVE